MSVKINVAENYLIIKNTYIDTQINTWYIYISLFIWGDFQILVKKDRHISSQNEVTLLKRTVIVWKD